MVTFDSLQQALRQNAKVTESPPKRLLSEEQYSAAFDILVKGSQWKAYEEFIIPQLSQLVAPLFNSRIHISVLEIGPGPKSLIGYLPGSLRQKVSRYTAYEPNSLFATRLERWFGSAAETDSPLPALKSPPDIRQTPFVLGDSAVSSTRTDMNKNDEEYDIILFYHGMGGIKPQRKFIERALDMLAEEPQGGIVAVLHHEETLHFDGLVCHRAIAFPTGVVHVVDDDEILDSFAASIGGFDVQDVEVDKAIRAHWRQACRGLGCHGKPHLNHLTFSSPTVMTAFTRHATALQELIMKVPLAGEVRTVKNWEARLHHPASIVRPTEVCHVQQCVRWALKHRVGLNVIGGGHSGHCIQSNIVSVDMGAFNQIHILAAGNDGENSGPNTGPLVIAEAGCTTGDIVRKAMEAGIAVPLGARPSVGAGLWLQGGIGHLARLHGLACDAIVGAVVVSVDSGQVLCLGLVPSSHLQAGAVRPENEADLLWALKGAGTNFGIVVSVVFKTYKAPTYFTRNWTVPLGDKHDARLMLGEFDRLVARKLPRNCSADAYLYWDAGQLQLGVTMMEVSTTGLSSVTPTKSPTGAIWGLEEVFSKVKTVDGVGLFDTEMYMAELHGGHGGGKTSSFKRCLFFKDIGDKTIAERMVAAIQSRPSPLCYLHLLQGGGAAGEVAAGATAFGCRDWDFACVLTGVWPREQDSTEVARCTVEWVYKVAENLMSFSSGAYGADLGPDPRDRALAARAFGSNGPRLARLKNSLDPWSVLAYTCPLPRAPMDPKLIILVTGASGVGKDYCANVWLNVFLRYTQKSLIARTASISDVTKREYAAATGADLSRLLSDRTYKEQHRPALTAFFQEQVQHRPQLPEEHFLDLVRGAAGVDVLIITGMRDEAPVAVFSHLIPESRLLDVHVQTSEEAQIRRECYSGGGGNDNWNSNKNTLDSATLDYCPSLIFSNDTSGDDMAKAFAEQNMLRFLHEDLHRLAGMVRIVPDFPRPDIQFRHVLGIAEQSGGLGLCTSLLQTHFTGDWTKIDAVVCCEAGGFIYASPLALQANVPFVPIREAGKLPPPTISVMKPLSHISASTFNNSKEQHIEMGRDVLPKGGSVVVVDDVLSSGKTLCAVLQLLRAAGIDAGNITVLVVAEFPIHRGRELLRQRGFGKVRIQSLLVFGGA